MRRVWLGRDIVVADLPPLGGEGGGSKGVIKGR